MKIGLGLGEIRKGSDMKAIKWIFGMVVGVVLMFLLYGWSLQQPHQSGYTQVNGRWVAADESDRKIEARRSIAACWQEQAKKSLAPDVARYAAKMCESQEDDYITAYRERP